MASRKSKQAMQPTHEQDGTPITDQASDPVPVGEVVDQVIQNVTARSEPATHVSDVTYNNARKLPDKLGIPVGDLRVQLIDKGDNSAGIGVRVLYPDGREPTGEEKEIIRDVMKSPNGEFSSGFRWDGQMGLWHKPIGDAPPHVATAIRLDAERRVEKIAKNLRELHGIEYSHADAVEESKGQSADPIPF
jgi:hypothetical protein